MNKRALPIAGFVTAAAIVAMFVASRIDPRAAAGAYLAAYGVATSVALGALLFVMIGHVTGARWFVPLRAYGNLLATLLVPLAVMLVPILLASQVLYPWARPASSLDIALAESLATKRRYLNVPFFVVRSAVYAITWAVLAWLLSRWSSEQERAPRADLAARIRAVSGAALPAIALTLTFAAFDWFMSLEPAWYSNAYGLYFFSGGFAGAVAGTTILAYLARRAGLLDEKVGASHFHACGRLLLTAVCLWAYLAFAQYFITWIAAIPEEARWYVLRTQGPWRPFAIVLVVAHFVVPFFALLQRAVTRHPGRLAIVAAWVLCAHVLDVDWLTSPAFHPKGPRFGWIDAAAMCAVTGVCITVGIWRFQREASAPHRDPAWRVGLRYESP